MRLVRFSLRKITEILPVMAVKPTNGNRYMTVPMRPVRFALDGICLFVLAKEDPDFVVSNQWEGFVVSASFLASGGLDYQFTGIFGWKFL